MKLKIITTTVTNANWDSAAKRHSDDVNKEISGMRCFDANTVTHASAECNTGVFVTTIYAQDPA